MATLVLSTAGRVIGGQLGGAIGSKLGQAVGAVAGSYVEQLLFGRRETVVGSRLEDLSVQSSTEGAPVPRIYGRVRLSGQVIWATNFDERLSTTTEGGKGAPSQTTATYRYFANFAVALCDGEISHIGRVWASGKLIDISQYSVRIYRGTEDQQPDALIEAVQGVGSTPAYRGIAYIVFEQMPLEDFGNTLPQLSFEVIRAVDDLEASIKAITIIPGATEFGYLPRAITRDAGLGTQETENQHLLGTESDWTASLDELQRICPNLEAVSLVVGWFGNDLDCGVCTLLPAVETRDRKLNGISWSVAGYNRSSAHLVSTVADRPAFGGTPDDQSVIEAIQDLKSRGLRVTLYPFILMDIPAENTLIDPYGGSQQAVNPWRGRVTCSPAPGVAGTIDQLPAARVAVEQFVGVANVSDFSIEGGSVQYSGEDQTSYRYMILHYAFLALSAGGVDTFLIGSEMPGMTKIRDQDDAFPFVDSLVQLAKDVRSISGAETEISYAADWSEYFGYHPNDGNNDVHYNMDALWADSTIDFVGIDNYMPIADWRDVDNVDGAIWSSIQDLDYLRANIEGGEYFDWHYATTVDRENGIRSPIADLAYGKDWVYRTKDLRSWWMYSHVPRIGGVEAAEASPWVPQSKPIRFVEFGAPAVDRAANQPNVFPDPNSSEGKLPYFSNGARDDLMQRRYLEAMTSYWDASLNSSSANNPNSSVYAGPMVDFSNMHIWAWDARPFPVFPYAQDIWTDGPNWATGHWLNGRLGSITLQSLVRQVLDDYQFADYELGAIGGVIQGFAINAPSAAKTVLSSVLEAFSIDVVDTGTAIRFLPSGRIPDTVLVGDELVEHSAGSTLVSLTRAQETELPSEIRFGFSDAGRDYAHSSVSSRRLVGQSLRVSEQQLPIIAPPETISAIADIRLQDSWYGRDMLDFQLPLSRLAVEPGDVLTLSRRDMTPVTLKAQRLILGYALRVEGRSYDSEIFRAPYRSPSGGRINLSAPAASAVVKLMDLPLFSELETIGGLRAAAYARPWAGGLTVFRSSSGSSYSSIGELEEPAVIGTLATDVQPGLEGRWDYANVIEVELGENELSTIDDLDLFAGLNLAAVECANGGWEVLQFSQAELVGASRYRLQRLLRAQGGTEDAMAAGALVGGCFVLLDSGTEEIVLSTDQFGLELQYRFLPVGLSLSDDRRVDIAHAGTGRGLKPLSPVHIRAYQQAETGDINIEWVRRTRLGGDSWESMEVPLSEDFEQYRVRIFDGEDVIREIETTETAAVYSATDQLADFGSLLSDLTLEVSQLSSLVGFGTARSISVSL